MKIQAILGAVLVLVPAFPGDSATAEDVPIAEMVGINHVGGRYNFTEKPFLREGAERIVELGSRTIKLWLNSRPETNYAFNSDWDAYRDDVESVTDLVRTPYYRDVLEMPFTTFYLMTTEFRHPDILTGLTDHERRTVYDEIFELTEYLLNEYQGTGKTFVLKNWESDNHIRLFELPEEKWRQPIDGMIDWVNTRQRAVSDARETVGMDGVAVYHAFEVVRIPVRRNFGHPTTLEAVVPYTNCDLYSYSNWAHNRRPGNQGLLIELLDYIAAITPPSEVFGHRNIFLGEWGTYEVAFMEPNRPDLEGDTRVHDARSDRMQREVVMRNLDLALGWGVRSALYWQLYCNGLRSGVTIEDRTQPASEEELRGVWLIRPGSERLGIAPSYTSTWQGLTEWMRQRFLFDDMQFSLSPAVETDNVEYRDDEVDYHPADPYRAGRVSSGPAWLRYELGENLRDFHVRLLHREPTGDLVGYWPLNEWEGNHAYDKSGFGNHGSRTQGVAVDEAAAPVAFHNPHAARFDGEGWISVPSARHYSVEEWTVAGWLNAPADLSGEGRRFAVSRKESPTGCHFAVGILEETGRLVAQISGNEEAVMIEGTDEDLRGTGWRSFALVSTGREVRLYLDGGAVAEVAAAPDPLTDQEIIIGGRRSEGTERGAWYGKLDEMRLYRRGLSGEEIQALADSHSVAFADAVRIRVSGNGQQWQSVPFRATHTRRMNANGVLSTFLRPVGELPDGARFFELAWRGEATDFPEVGSVALRTGN